MAQCQALITGVICCVPMKFEGRLKAEEGGVCGLVVGGDTSFEAPMGKDEAVTFGVLARQVQRWQWSWEGQK